MYVVFVLVLEKRKLTLYVLFELKKRKNTVYVRFILGLEKWSITMYVLCILGLEKRVRVRDQVVLTRDRTKKPQPARVPEPST